MVVRPDRRHGGRANANLNQFWLANGKRSRFVQRDRVDSPSFLDELTSSDKHSVAGRPGKRAATDAGHE